MLSPAACRCLWDTVLHENIEKSLHNKSMGNLNNDIVLEVILCFRPRDAVRCKSLNKNFNAYISNKRFAHEHFVKSIHKVCNLIHFLNTSPSVFYQLQLDRPYPLETLEVYEILPIQVPILASCGGFLLHILRYKNYCVFSTLSSGNSKWCQTKIMMAGLMGQLEWLLIPALIHLQSDWEQSM